MPHAKAQEQASTLTFTDVPMAIVLLLRSILTIFVVGFLVRSLAS
jgi:competence protein ComGC